MENSIEITSSELSKRIYTLRGVQVMLDTDLAESYQVETKRLKEAVKRNLERFPADFMFETTNDEVEVLRSQFATSNVENSWTRFRPNLGNDFEMRGGSRYMPFAFTELGIAMLSSVLNSQRAIQINIEIMRAFVQFRKQPKADFKSLENVMKMVLEKLNGFEVKPSQGRNDSRKSIQSSASIIQNIVAEHFGLQVEELKAPTRTQAILRARHIAIYLMRKHTHMSLNEIGSHFGQRDHSTILHACQKIEAISGKIKNLDHRVFSALASKA